MAAVDKRLLDRDEVIVEMCLGKGKFESVENLAEILPASFALALPSHTHTPFCVRFFHIQLLEAEKSQRKGDEFRPPLLSRPALYYVKRRSSMQVHDLARARRSECGEYFHSLLLRGTSIDNHNPG